MILYHVKWKCHRNFSEDNLFPSEVHSYKNLNLREWEKVIDVFQRTCSCLLDTWKKELRNTGFLLLLFLCMEQFTDTNLFTFLQDRAAHFFWTCTMYIYYLLLHLFPSLCRILYFDAANFSIKLFSLIYFTVSVVRQREENEIVT